MNKPAKDTSDPTCNTQDCLYYKHRNLFHRHHFLWTIVLFMIFIIVVFLLLNIQYNRNQEKIVAIHDAYCENLQETIRNTTVVKDSCFYINDIVLLKIQESQQNVAHILELQFGKLQTDFTILSLWSGILMIVFLVFSIYSVFKTDELMKQSRDVLQHADEASGKVDVKIEEINRKMELEAQSAAERLEKRTEAELDKIRSEIDTTIQKFKELTDSKADEYQKKYKSYLDELEKSSQKNQELINLLIETVRSSDSDSKSSKNQ